MRVAILALLAAAVIVSPPRVPADCADCDADGRVGINELLIGVNIVLGRTDLGTCLAFDRDANGSVVVSELIAAVGQALDGCAADATPTPTATPEPADQRPPTVAAELRTWLEAGRYRAWAAESAPHPGTGPHFGVVRVFVNDALFGSLSAGDARHPDGAAAVKELYGGGDEVQGWSVMVKLQDESDEGRGWYWFETFGTFSTGGIGLRGCASCHAAGNDYIRIPFPLQ